jgi:hypothetical protein
MRNCHMKSIKSKRSVARIPHNHSTTILTKL